MSLAGGSLVYGFSIYSQTEITPTTTNLTETTGTLTKNTTILAESSSITESQTITPTTTNLTETTGTLTKNTTPIIDFLVETGEVSSSSGSYSGTVIQATTYNPIETGEVSSSSGSYSGTVIQATTYNPIEIGEVSISSGTYSSSFELSYSDFSPSITIGPDLVIETTFENKVVTYQAPTATDTYGMASGPTCTPESGSLFPNGVTTVTCTATNILGNVTEETFTVTVTDHIGAYTISAFDGGDCSFIGTYDVSTLTCTLTEDVTVDDSGGIIIGSDGITLDGGNSYGIYGTATGTGAGAALAPNYGTSGGTVSPDGQYGVLIDGKDNVTIRNIGAIQSFHAGIVVKNANNVDILSNSISNLPYSAIQIVGSNDVTMTSNTINNVLTSWDHGCAVQISSSATVTLNQNNISGDAWGYCITNSNGVDIDANNIASNMGAHINGVPESSNIQIRNMQFSSGKEIWIGGCHPSCSTTIVKSVTITGNTFDGYDHAIIFDHVQGITISDNIFKNSHSQMVWFMGGNTGGHTITGNTFADNSGEALRLGPAMDNDGSTITGNTFTNNNVAFANCVRCHCNTA